MQAIGFAHPKRTVEALSIARGSAVADFGAGSGHYALSLAEEVGADGTVYAIDVQVDLLSRIKNEAHRKGYKNIHCIHGDIERMSGSKLRARSVDVVVMSNVLFQLSEPLNAFSEARRILKLDGRLVVIDWVISGASGRLGPAKDTHYSKQKALADARASHFEYVGEFDAGEHHYGLVCIPV